MSTFVENHLKVFGKAQTTAAVATLTDFLVLALLVEFLGVYYVVAVALAAASGGVVNFVLNRKWAFGSNRSVSKEAFRYTLVSGGSLLWNTFFVWILTDFFGFQYMISKILTVAWIGLFWNYPLHRYWVFVKEESQRKPSLG